MKTRLAIIVFLVVIIINISGCSEQLQTSLVKSEGVKYTLYIGLNDKDTYTQKVSNEEAEKKVSQIALKYVDGFTKITGIGAFKDDKGIITYENSLIFSFYFANDDKMQNIMDEVLIELNQNSILIEKQKVNYEYYEGANK